MNHVEALPLLGPSLGQAVRECAALAASLGEHPDPVLERRLLARGGEIALAQHSTDAISILADAGRFAAEAGDRHEALRLGLLVCRALALSGKTHAAKDRLAVFSAQVASERGLDADLHITAVACDEGDARAHLDAALAVLPSPARDHDRLAALLSLAALLHDGGDPGQTRMVLDQALTLALHHQDSVSACHISSLLGNLLVELGLSQDAEPHLLRAVDLAGELDDTLTLVTEGSILAAVRLTRQDWTGAREIACRYGTIAARRGNWLGFADAAITESTCLLHEQGLGEAITVLWTSALIVRSGGTPAAQNLLSARLAELRIQRGHDDFDPVFELIRLTVDLP